MANLTEITTLCGTLLTAISVIFGVSVFLINSRRERIKKTLDFWENINQQLKNEKRDLHREFGTKITEEQAVALIRNRDDATKINRVLNIYERMALGVNLGVYDIKVLNRLVGFNLISNFERFEKYIIERRKKFNRPFAWKEFEILIVSIKKHRK